MSSPWARGRPGIFPEDRGEANGFPASPPKVRYYCPPLKAGL